MLVAYDEIDFDPGQTKFKEGGGHGGHNGIRDIISALGNKKDFYRLGRPRTKHFNNSRYVRRSVILII